MPGKLASRFDSTHPLRPVFRDQTELTSGELGEAIDDALLESEALIVICSPAAAQSRWVEAEIRRFKQFQGNKRVFAIIVAGTPNSPDPDEQCFPKALQTGVDSDGRLTDESIEMLAANINGPGGSRDAHTRLTAALLGIGFDDLKQREQQRRQRRYALIAAGALAIAAVTTGLSIKAYFAEKEAVLRRGQADDLIGFMLGDLRGRLETIGRIDVLDDVGDKAMEYFSSLSRSEDSATLDKRALTIRQIGEVRVAQGRYDDGLAAFNEAMSLFERSNAISEADGARLFYIAHTHFWIADAHFRRLDYEAAEREIVAYRDVSQQLVDRYPENNEYRHELASAESNLGTLAYRRGHFSDARTRFAAAEEAARVIVASEPDNEIYASSMSTTLSWLGSAEISLGNLQVGTDLHREEVAINRANVAVSDDMREREYLAIALQVLSVDLARLGQVDEAVAADLEAVDIYTGLVAFDPENNGWLRRLVRGKSILARHRLQTCELEGIDGLLNESRDVLERLLAAEPADANVRIDLANTGVELARYAALSGDPDRAAGYAQKSHAAFRELNVERADDVVNQRAYARAAAMRVLLHNRSGDQAAASSVRALLATDFESNETQDTDVVGWLTVIGELTSPMRQSQTTSQVNYHPPPLLPACDQAGESSLH